MTIEAISNCQSKFKLEDGTQTNKLIVDNKLDAEFEGTKLRIMDGKELVALHTNTGGSITVGLITSGRPFLVSFGGASSVDFLNMGKGKILANIPRNGDVKMEVHGEKIAWAIFKHKE